MAYYGRQSEVRNPIKKIPLKLTYLNKSSVTPYVNFEVKKNQFLSIQKTFI